MLAIICLYSYLRNGRLVCPLLVGAAPPPPPPSLADMNGRATRLEMVADLAELLFLTVVLLPPPFWLVLEDEPAEADRWIPLSPLELPELEETGRGDWLYCLVFEGCFGTRLPVNVPPARCGGDGHFGTFWAAT